MKSYTNVFDALFNNKEEAENLRLRSELMIQLSEYIEKNSLTQKQAADKLGVAQPRLSNLVNGQIDKFTIDTLVNMLTKTGAEVKINVLRNEHKEDPVDSWKNLVRLDDYRRKRTAQKSRPKWNPGELEIEKGIETPGLSIG